MNADEIWVGMYVTHHEYTADPPSRVGYPRPAYLDPPLIGVVVEGVNGHTGTCVVQWPKGTQAMHASLPGTLQAYPSELEVASHRLIELEAEASSYNLRQVGA
ncbi:MAG TPA: hypothetical protein VLA89_11110 [Gemmatimonadales bacterium]|nr:hypothetical protein [Gemmatimonadales bacterium]